MATEALTIPAREEEPSAVACRHYWVIEPPEGAVSQGECRNCREVREFKNFLEDAPWKEDWPWPPKGDRMPIKVSRVSLDDMEDF